MSETRDRLIDTAMPMLQERGYNGFSFHDLADEVGIKTASIHYHFPTKGDLAIALAQQYRKRFMAALGEAGDQPPTQQLRRYINLFRATLLDRKLCLCGMMAAQIEDLPEAARAEVNSFFEDNISWLKHIFLAAQHTAPEAEKLALFVLSTLEGAMLISRSGSDTAAFDAISDALSDILSLRREKTGS
jgi:TetR/AcrR family transcriptional regulator, transcriptional repressor for nem operon